MHRLPNCPTSRFVRQPSVCEGIKQSSFSLNSQLFFSPLPHACLSHVTVISFSPLNWQSKSLISVKVVSTMLSSTQYSHFMVKALLKTNQISVRQPCPRKRPGRATSSLFSTWRIFSRDAKRKQEFGNVIG